jgi:hypothetical protein
MSGEKDKSGVRKKQLSALQSLCSIKPIPPKYRFLISWDAKKKMLRFGCGHGENAVIVCSNRELERTEWTDDSGAKLEPGCVKRFVSRGARVEGKELLRSCERLLRSYMHAPDERIYSLLAVWSIATYVYPIFSHFGYLFLHSRFPRSGKTRVEEILSHLCFEATVPLNAPTVPMIRDTAAEGHTLVLDTLERWKEKNPEAHGAAMELLDAGFRNGGTVAKMVSAGEGKWRREMFPVYAPYVLAAIAKESLTDTALDRAFVIEMHRKPTKIKKQKYSFHRCEQECLPLRDDLYRWALENARVLAARYESAGLEAELDALELNDRAADIWKPLLAVARVLGNSEVWQSLTSLAVEMCRDPEAAERARISAIARSLRKLVNGSGAAVGMTSDFVTHLRADGLEVQERDLHGMLAQWGFTQGPKRLEQGPRRAWELPDTKLAEIESENGPISPLEM